MQAGWQSHEGHHLQPSTAPPTPSTSPTCPTQVGPGEVLIRVRSASVNPVDWKVAAGYLDALMQVDFPAIPGWDVAGVVEAVGLDTPEYAVGDKVIAYARKDWVHDGTFAELVAAPVRTVARKPALDWDQAAGLPLAGLTAYQLLTPARHEGGRHRPRPRRRRRRRHPRRPDREALGARVIGTASEGNHEFLRGLGAEPVTYGDGLAERVRASRPTASTSSSTSSGGVLETTLAVLKDGGRHGRSPTASVAGTAGSPPGCVPTPPTCRNSRTSPRRQAQGAGGPGVPLGRGGRRRRVSQGGHVGRSRSRSAPDRRENWMGRGPAGSGDDPDAAGQAPRFHAKGGALPASGSLASKP